MAPPAIRRIHWHSSYTNTHKHTQLSVCLTLLGAFSVHWHFSVTAQSRLPSWNPVVDYRHEGKLSTWTFKPVPRLNARKFTQALKAWASRPNLWFSSGMYELSFIWKTENTCPPFFFQVSDPIPIKKSKHEDFPLQSSLADKEKQHDWLQSLSASNKVCANVEFDEMRCPVSAANH